MMALPLAAAVPLMLFLTLAPWLPVGTGRLMATEMRVFLAGTLAGVPIVVCASWIIRNLCHLRYRPFALMTGLTVFASSAVAAVWIGIDMQSMAAIEHYDRAGWYLVALPGAYAAAVLCLVAQAVVRAGALSRRLRGG
jgi:hypothetical protein